eukprot:gnl/TRDRNA2_/TRDRNA2_167884_c0_seq2.p1 gnl/TRDRNA2_/TRDRNA2_167884_c0~~gnl/TRDRNA2_/TRDRNA2_167884_c0_seq2.p1  ORF type:complete len:219 (-),score=27.12 gnl/TRDRNA2_/TRDRNA2_167884_c0_seq2:663-1319(-)
MCRVTSCILLASVVQAHATEVVGNHIGNVQEKPDDGVMEKPADQLLDPTDKLSRKCIDRALIASPPQHRHANLDGTVLGKFPFGKSKKHKHSGGVRHIVMYGVKEGVTDDQIAALRRAMEEMPAKIWQIKGWEFGLDLKLPTWSAVANRKMFWSADFDNVEAYEIYQKHPVHQECLRKIKEIMKPDTRAAVQLSNAKSRGTSGIRHCVMYGVKKRSEG